MEKTIQGIGKVVFKESTKAKQVNITVKPFVDVVVSVPTHIQFAQAEAAVTKNIHWIKKEQLRMKKVESQYTIFKVGQVFQVQDLSFEIKKAGKEFQVLTPANSYIVLQIPSLEKIKDLKVQNWIREHMEQIVKKRAATFLPQKALQLAQQHQITIQKVQVRKSLTRWGSCGNQNTLNLSYFLLFLPIHLIEYAILHELAHIKVKDHSKAYWMHLESMVTGARLLDSEIKGYGIGVF